MPSGACATPRSPTPSATSGPSRTRFPRRRHHRRCDRSKLRAPRGYIKMGMERLGHSILTSLFGVTFAARGVRMPSMYHDGQRDLQVRYDTQRLADRLEEQLVGDTT